ncbi:hypothetical protein FCV25MIE_01560 [Fagus crenata]
MLVLEGEEFSGQNWLDWKIIITVVLYGGDLCVFWLHCSCQGDYGGITWRCCVVVTSIWWPQVALFQIGEEIVASMVDVDKAMKVAAR